MPAIINPNTFRQLLAEYAAQIGDDELYVFGYGSLMWRPGFRVRESAAARVHGYARRLSVRSTHYRGTPQKPGLVFGLDSGGSCNGVVLRAAGDTKRILRGLFRREMFANVYEPRFVCAHLSGGDIRALTFVVRREGNHYVPPMSPQRAAKIIRAAKGFGGDNADYVKNTREELARRGVPCPQLARLCALL